MRFVVIFVLLISAYILQAEITVPFVGCASDGQAGPLPPPSGAPKRVSIPAAMSEKLAYYQAEQGPGVLAPRGWHCFGTYGSSGGSLFVTPEILTRKNFFTDPHITFRGFAVQVSDSLGGTSGRLEVAEIIARLFPAHRAFAIHVRDEGLGLDKLPAGPAKTDKLHYLSEELVEYTTPANCDGEGTHSWLKSNNQPIYGLVMLTGEELSAVSLAVRLPPDAVSLVPYIEKELEH